MAGTWATSHAAHARLISQRGLHKLHVAGWSATCTHGPVSQGWAWPIIAAGHQGDSDVCTTAWRWNAGSGTPAGSERA